MAKDTKPTRWGRILLVGSLALNLLIVGIVAGAMLKGGPKGGAPRFDLTIGPLTRAMDDSQRDAVRQALRESGAFRPADRSNMRADMAAMVASLRADSFDPEGFRAVLSRQRARLQAGQEAAIDAVVTSLEGMSAQDRASFADRLEEQLRPRPSGRTD